MGRVAFVAAAAALAACSKDAPAKPTVVEVRAQRTAMAGQDLSVAIDDETVAEIAAQPGVSSVVPRMQLVVPATGRVTLEGQELSFQVGFFADGVDPAVVGEPKFRAGDVVPVILSPTVIELYNERYAPSHGLPVIGDLEEYLLEKRAARFTIRLADQRDVEAELVAISDRALDLGMTLPLETVRAWNREFAGEGAASRYSSLTVTIDERRLAPFEAWLGDNGLRVR